MIIEPIVISIRALVVFPPKSLSEFLLCAKKKKKKKRVRVTMLPKKLPRRARD
jgi:hypothetical protein